MKKINHILLFAVVLATASCKKDFLELTPEDAYTSDNFFRTEEHFQSAINAAYAPLRAVLIKDYSTW